MMGLAVLNVSNSQIQAHTHVIVSVLRRTAVHIRSQR